MIGAYFFDNDQQAMEMAATLSRWGERTYAFRVDDATLPSVWYFSNAQSDAPDDGVCLGRGEDGEWMSLKAVGQHKAHVANVAAMLQEHLV